MKTKITVKRISRTLYLQHDQSDCGIACLLSILRLYGSNQSLEKLRELSGTTRQGTTVLGLYQAAKHLGFTTQGCEAEIQELIDYKKPVILHVVLEKRLQHFVVCYKYSRERGFLIGDPAKGVYYLSKEDLKNIWVSKACLLLEPNENFLTRKRYLQLHKEWFLRLLTEDRQLLVLIIVSGVFIAVLGMAMSVFSQKLIDDILPSQDVTKLYTGIVLLALLLLSRIGLMIFRQHLLLQQSRSFNNRINNTFFTSLLNLPITFFESRRIGDFVARLNDTQRIQKVIRLLAGSVIIDLLVVVISLIFLFFYSLEVGAIAAFTVPLLFLIVKRNNKIIIKSQKDVMEAYSFNESNYISSISGISTIKNHNKHSFFSKLNVMIYGNYQDKIFNLGKVNIKLSWLSGLTSAIFLIAILSFSSLAVLNEQMQLGELMAILGISGSLLPSVVNIAMITIPLNEAQVAFNRMYEFSSMEKEKDYGELIDHIERIEITNMSFRFAGHSELFSNINFSIKKGKMVAIVGESGSGKSTIAQILQRFYPFDKGEIIVNGQFHLSDLNLESYRNLIGVISQDIHIFNGSVKDNILLGEADEVENLMDFIDKYELKNFFNSLPQGLASILGEEGIKLSGGQKQMIAFARVLYKKPQFLILDESTAAMDRKTEELIMKLLYKIKENCAILFISHKLQTLREFADEIYVLEDRTLATKGNHDDLVRSSNFYSDFWT